MVSPALDGTLSLFTNRQLIDGCLEYLQVGLKEGLKGMVENSLAKGETMSAFNLVNVNYSKSKIS